jgi:DNA-directed RNA polymerase subunit RPC12/RpoP
MNPIEKTTKQITNGEKFVYLVIAVINFILYLVPWFAIKNIDIGLNLSFGLGGMEPVLGLFDSTEDSATVIAGCLIVMLVIGLVTWGYFVQSIFTKIGWDFSKKLTPLVSIVIPIVYFIIIGVGIEELSWNGMKPITGAPIIILIASGILMCFIIKDLSFGKITDALGEIQKGNTIVATTVCAHCGAIVKVHDAFCATCGAPIEKSIAPTQSFCSKCGTPLTVNATFCTNCGNKVIL